MCCNSIKKLPSVWTALNNQHTLVAGTELDLSNNAGIAELLAIELLESRYNSSAGSNGEQLQINTTNPSYSWQLVLVEQVIGLIIESPLADYQCGTRIFTLLDLLLQQAMESVQKQWMIR